MNVQINENRTCKSGLKQIDPRTNHKPIPKKPRRKKRTERWTGYTHWICWNKGTEQRKLTALVCHAISLTLCLNCDRYEHWTVKAETNSFIKDKRSGWVWIIIGTLFYVDFAYIMERVCFRNAFEVCWHGA